MGLFDEIKGAFAEAGQTMAQVTGMDDDADSNTLIGDNPFTGTFGTARVERQMLPSGGYRQRTVLDWVAIRTQFDAAPVANVQLTRTDMLPQLTYRIERVLFHDPVNYICTLVRVGE